jgi:anaerobic selenocysteine-containing dehydrogenase
VIRACALLPAVTGNLGKPGAGFLHLNWNWNAPCRYLDDAYLTAPHLAAGPLPLISHMDLATCIEPASARAEADGHTRVPLPLADPRPAEGHLRLLSPASSWLLSDSFDNVAKISARLSPATIALHPADAAERGLAEGDEALVANETGGLTLRVKLSEAVLRGVALSHKGRWPKREPARANVNVLNPG